MTANVQPGVTIHFHVRAAGDARGVGKENHSSIASIETAVGDQGRKVCRRVALERDYSTVVAYRISAVDNKMGEATL